jgi:hypothetical protein
VPAVVVAAVAAIDVNANVSRVEDMGAAFGGRTAGSHTSGQVNANGEVDVDAKEVADLHVSNDVGVDIEETGLDGDGKSRKSKECSLHLEKKGSLCLVGWLVQKRSEWTGFVKIPKEEKMSV